MKVNPLTSIGFWRSYVMTMRPYLLFISGAAGLVGLAFNKNPTVFRTILAFIPLFLSYGLGQALTDCFQTDTDALSSPYRPLIKGTISQKQVLLVSLVGLSLGVLILGYLNPFILLFGAIAVIGLLTYTIFKRTWWGGPPWNSWIVAMLPVIARLTDLRYDIRTFFYFRDTYALAFFLAILAIFFGYANFVVMGYFKDITADRQTGYKTFPVVFGWRAAAVYSDLLAIDVAILTGVVLAFLGSFNIFAVAIYVGAVLLNLHGQVKIHRTRDERKTYRPITKIVRAFILYCAAIIVNVKPMWLPLIVVYYILFELTLKIRPEESQV